MRILVVGAGSTGGYFGGRLAQAGRDVTFLVRPARAARLRADGLRIVSPHGDAALAPALVEAGSVGGPYDAVLLTVKAFSLDEALRDMAPAVGPGTMILPVLNGMKHVDALAERFGPEAVVGCVCKIATQVDAQGRIVQLTPLHFLAYGEMGGAPSERTARLDAALRGAGFDALLSPTIAQDMWEKWIFLAALGGVTCLMRGPIGEIAAAPGGRDFALAFLDEVAAVARAAGHPPGEGFLTETRALLTQEGSGLTSSMYRDLREQRPVEADQILGDLLARGRALGVATPLVAAAYAHLSVYGAGLPGR
ncbi:2-dehydropantoate 2-reductase [Methylobacterium crusticola]|uniref:2-dehydropantoate 2-reductase n=1 Tax=Methylobacterium crusticola TaxID=1697972 RepID=A0ABQ4QTJ5_9HYPH|nr:2-dehydropantoate 2-reductase [Methylobacterium crusticola]GJD48512.1 2-dehydropantoate 2-reductase [Methylobacterium crusticola]